MAEDPYQNPMNEKVVSDMNDKLSNSNTILKKIAEECTAHFYSIIYCTYRKNFTPLLSETKEIKAYVESKL